MTLLVTPDVEALVKQRVASGQFADESAVVREAMELLDRRDRLEQLRASLDRADDEIDRGDGTEWTPDLLDQLTREAQDDLRHGRSIIDDVQP